MANSYTRGDKDTRPWGTWEVLDVDTNHCVKKICVTPHNQLSLQLHHHRCEHWIIVKGEAKVTLDDKIIVRKTNESIYIPSNTKHRIENDTDQNVEFIEIQIGDNLDENDIIRFEDRYGRV